MEGSPIAASRSPLRAAREAARLSRSELAERSGVASATIKAYELGLRHPSQPLLTVLLDSMESDRLVRNRVLEAAGFRPDGLDVWTRNADFALTLEEALQEIDAYRWPALLTGEGLKFVAANAAYARLFGGPAGSGESRAAGGFLSWMSYPPYADRLKNWDEVMKFLIGTLKGSLRFPEVVPEGTSTHIRAALERFFAGDAAYISRYLALWEQTPAARAKARFSYRIVFDHPAFGMLSFRCLGMGVNEMDGLIVNDWIPEDAETWARLGTAQSHPKG